MDEDIVCYFCGRTNDEVRRYIKEGLLIKVDEKKDKRRFQMLQDKFDQDFFIKMMHVSIPIGRRERTTMHQKSEPLKAIEKCISTYDLTFDESFTLLKRASEILQPIIDNRYKYSNDAARNAVMIEVLNKDEDIIIDVDEGVLKNLLDSYKHIKGQFGKYDEWRKEYYLPDKLEVPICYVCKRMIEMFQPDE